MAMHLYDRIHVAKCRAEPLTYTTNDENLIRFDVWFRVFTFRNKGFNFLSWDFAGHVVVVGILSSLIPR
jgi:hypothetical protein